MEANLLSNVFEGLSVPPKYNWVIKGETSIFVDAWQSEVVFEISVRLEFLSLLEYLLFTLF